MGRTARNVDAPGWPDRPWNGRSTGSRRCRATGVCRLPARPRPGHPSMGLPLGAMAGFWPPALNHRRLGCAARGICQGRIGAGGNSLRRRCRANRNRTGPHGRHGGHPGFRRCGLGPGELPPESGGNPTPETVGYGGLGDAVSLPRWSIPCAVVELVETPGASVVEPVETPAHPGGRACRDPVRPPAVEPVETRPYPGGRACPRWSRLSRPGPCP